MKMIRINHKTDFGIRIKIYAFTEFKKIEFDEKFTFVKLCLGVDVMEGPIERFDIEKWMKFGISDEKSIFEIFIG
jgi:hypothetical protein